MTTMGFVGRSTRKRVADRGGERRGLVNGVADLADTAQDGGHPGLAQNRQPSTVDVDVGEGAMVRERSREPGRQRLAGDRLERWRGVVRHQRTGVLLRRQPDVDVGPEGVGGVAWVSASGSSSGTTSAPAERSCFPMRRATVLNPPNCPTTTRLQPSERLRVTEPLTLAQHGDPRPVAGLAGQPGEEPHGVGTAHPVSGQPAVALELLEGAGRQGPKMPSTLPQSNPSRARRACRSATSSPRIMERVE